MLLRRTKRSGGRGAGAYGAASSSCDQGQSAPVNQCSGAGQGVAEAAGAADGELLLLRQLDTAANGRALRIPKLMVSESLVLMWLVQDRQ